MKFTCKARQFLCQRVSGVAAGWCAFRQWGESVHPHSEKAPEFSSWTTGKILWHVLFKINCGAGMFPRLVLKKITYRSPMVTWTMCHITSLKPCAWVFEEMNFIAGFRVVFLSLTLVDISNGIFLCLMAAPPLNVDITTLHYVHDDLLHLWW